MCLHNKSCNKIMAFRPHQLSMAKAIEKKKVTSSSNFSERDIFTPLRTSNPAFISNHYSAKNLGMSSKYTWYKYERRFFLCQMKTLPICANSETLESPHFLYWRGEKISFISYLRIMKSMISRKISTATNLNFRTLQQRIWLVNYRNTLQ